MTVLRRELGLASISLSLAAALGGAGVAAARFARDSGAASETLLLALWGGIALAPLAWVALRPGVRSFAASLAVAAAALGVALTVALLPRAGASRPAAVALLLVIALAAVAAQRFAAATKFSTASCAALALSFTLIAHGPRLWVDPLAPATLLAALLLPALATAVAWGIARRGEPTTRERSGLAFGLLLVAPLVAREPWPILLALVTIVALACGSTAVSRFARRALAPLAGIALLGASFPWLRAAPVSTVLSALLSLPQPAVELHDRTLNLTAARPSLELALDGGPITSLRLDSYLTNSTGLPCGTSLAAVVFEGGGPSFHAELVVGRDSAEWAADRPDVARSIACAPPPAWLHFVPATGRFFGRFSRTTLTPPAELYPDRLRIERHPDLPDDLAISIFELVAER